MINFRVEMDSLREIENALGTHRDKTKQVLKSAINNTATQTFKFLFETAQQEYAIKQKNEIKKTMTLTKAKVSNLTATISSKGRVNELYNFVVDPLIYVRGGGVPGGYKGKALRKGSKKRLILKQGVDGDDYKAFVVRYKSGHMTVGQRVPGKRMKSNPKKEFVKTLLSPSVPKMLGDEQGVWGIVEPQMYDTLQRNIQSQIQRYL